MSAEEEDNNNSNIKNGSATKRKSNPGVRLVHGRLYDSVNGKTCHWCRQKTVEDHVQCCKCPIKFCGPCLKNRHGENIVLEMQEGNSWVCPKCRKGCGSGCNRCCNCGPCRKMQGLEKTGMIVHHARAAGFSNAHDYLVFQNTQESPNEIASRKKGRGWCKSGDHFLSKPEEFGTKFFGSPMTSTSCKQSATDSEVSHASGSVRTNIMSPCSEDRLPNGCNNLGQNKRLKANEVCVLRVKMEDLSSSIPSQGHEFVLEGNPTSGVRVDGCPTYDVANGKTCHWCRQKRLQDHVHCSRCTVHFCGPCLMNRHGENIVVEIQEGNAWVCPRCRKGCGPGCMNCCNCGPCRKEQGLEATGQIVQVARSAGFTNVHDYLIFKTTGESPREISHRKVGRGWCISVEYFWSNPEEFELHSQRSRHRCTGNEQTLPTQERMRGSLSEEQVKQLSQSYLPKGYSTAEKVIKLPHDSIITEFAVNNSSANNPSLSGPIHSMLCNATPAAAVSTPICTQTSVSSSSKLAFQSQNPIPSVSGTTNLSNEGNGQLSYSPVVKIDSSPSGSEIKVKVEAEPLHSSYSQPVANIDFSLSAKEIRVKVEAQPLDSSYSQPGGNIDSTLSGSEIMVKVGAQPLHSAFNRDVSDSIWAKYKDFEIPLAVRDEKENFQTETVNSGNKIDCDVEDEDYKFFINNVRLHGLSYVLDLKVKQDGSTTSIKYEDPSSSCRNIKTCIYNENRKKRRLSCTGEINHAQVDLKSSRFPVAKDCAQQMVKTEVPSPEASSPSDVTTVGNIECSEIPFYIQPDDFKENLEVTLQKPYNTQEFHELWTAINDRKPIVRFRHTRQRTISVETQKEGFSYLDYHLDLSDRLASSTSPEEKLTLLRGFFFWLTHASWPKAFQPWVSSPVRKHMTDDDDSDCVEVDGLDSETANPIQKPYTTELTNTNGV